MKAAIFQSTKHFDQHITDKIIKLLNENDIEYDNDSPDIVFYVGGDGTFLRAIQKYLNILKQIIFIGIKNGTLGFFYGFGLDDLESVIKKIKNNLLTIHRYPLLEGLIDYGNKVKKVYALNEIRIENPFHTLISDVFINNELLETFRGNGLCICSSLGSTAYNKSLGGALIDPSTPLFELTEIASLSNNIYRSLGSSMILSKNQTIKLSGDFPSLIVGYDHLSSEENNAKSIELSISNRIVNVAYDKDFSFIGSIRKSFIK